MKTTRIVTVIDSFLILEGLRSVINGSDKLSFEGNIRDLLQLGLPGHREPPDILILELSSRLLPGPSGSFHLPPLSPRTRVILMAQSFTPAQIREWMGQGINSFLFYNCDKKEITDAIAATHKGNKFFCSQSLDMAFPENGAAGSYEQLNLSDREIEVIGLMVKGLSSKEIRERLHVSIHTINTHKKNIFRKLHVNKASDLVLFALRHGLGGIQPLLN